MGLSILLILKDLEKQSIIEEEEKKTTNERRSFPFKR